MGFCYAADQQTRGSSCLRRESRAARNRRSVARAAGTLLVIVGLAARDVDAQAHRIEAPAEGLLESGAPLYSIRTQETLGLSAPPTDMHRMPDGRILVFAGQEIAFGDGSRWEIFHQADDEVKTPSLQVAVDRDGQIYMGVPAGFARVEFDDNAQWRLKVVAPWSVADGSNLPILRHAIQVAGEWFWHSGTGALFSWRPGEKARFRGRADTIEQVLKFRDSFYLSDHTNGRLWRLGEQAMEPVAHSPSISVSETLTCGLPLAADQLLVGTYARGLQVFDGTRTRPFGDKSVLTGAIRINDLCETEGGFLAAAIENVGIVFFDRHGNVLQVLDRALDHRLSHVRRLVAGGGGEVWGQVAGGVVRVEFPARVSHYEPLIGASLVVAHPHRLDGRLWVMADGKAHRGVYDPDGRLVRLEADTPPDRFIYAFSCALGRPVAGTDRGAYYRDEQEWKAFFPLSANLCILHPEPIQGRWLYGAVGEVGWLRPTADGIQVERIPVSGLGNIYNALSEADGSVWFELGNSRVGRLQLVGDAPVVDFFDRQDGLPEGWVNLFAIGDHVNFNVEGRILRFDDGTHHFTPDAEFARQFPSATDIIGRPARDARGRVWISTNGAVHVYEQRGDTWHDVGERLPPGFLPRFFTAESNGVVWMHAERRFARFDPAVPLPAVAPLKTMITHLSLPGSGRTIFTTGGDLPEFDYDDNSFVAHFMASGNPFVAPVRFEVMFEGAGNSWVSAGGGGSAAFNRLKEGRHLLRVRPLSGGVVGEEATLAIVVRPPWYRATSAYVGYSAGAVGLILVTIWVATLLTRREKRRLQQAVLERTRQLAEANTRIADMELEATRSARASTATGGGRILAG